MADPTPEKLERFFFLDEEGLKEARKKRRKHNRLGWSVQWGTVRMLGTFLEDPLDVPRVVVEYAAEQLGIDDPSCIKQYAERRETQYEHTGEIRDLLKFREFADAEDEVRTYVASRVAKTRDSRRELFDRAVLRLVEERVQLPGITTLARLVRDVQLDTLEEINAAVVTPTPVHTRRELIGTLEVPDGKRVSTLEWMRTPVVKLTGTGQVEALDRASYVFGLGTGAIDLSGVAPVKLAELASYGLHAKAPKIKKLKGERRVATLVATVRQLERSSVDDALLLFDLLMSTKLLSGATRKSNSEKLKTFPKLKTAASRMAAAWAVVLRELPEVDGKPVSMPQVMSAVEQVVSRDDLAAAVEAVRELLPPPGEDDDSDSERRAALVDRYATVKPFIELLASVVPWGCTEAGGPILAALRGLPKLLAAKKPGVDHIRGFEDLATGSWRRLVFANPKLEAPLIDRSAFVFAVLEQLHDALRRRDVYAVGADKWGDPRVQLIEPRVWVRERDTVLTALGLPADPREHLAELADLLDRAYRQVGAGLASNDAARIADGKLTLTRLEAAPYPEGYQAVHDAVAGMLPRIDYPELILEVNACTGFLDVMPHISGSEARRDDLDLSLAALLVGRSTNIGLTPVAKPGTTALSMSRLLGVEKGYFHGEAIGKSSARLVDKQAEIGITADWGGGMVASTDGLRFVVPVRSLHSRPSPLYFGVGKRPRGTTWLNTVSDKVMGLGGLVVPGTLRDSLYILDAIHRLDATEHPEIITTDQGSYSDIVYGMFAACGYQFAPRHADITDTQLWWLDLAMLKGEITRDHRGSNGWGAFNTLPLRRVSIPAIVAEWDDMMRVAGSLATSKVRAYDLIKMMTAGGRLTGLGNAFAAYGRIFKTLHLLQVISVEAYRRMIGTQLNIGESRHDLARNVFFGNLGRLTRGYERGMENQLGALGLGLNAITWWNSLYVDAAVNRLEAGGLGVGAAIRARLSPLLFAHINFHGSYPFQRPDLKGRLRDLHDPNAADAEPEQW